MGSVFDTSFLAVTQAKLEYVVSRNPVCKSCNLDPLNRLTEEFRAEARGQVPAGSSDSLLESLVDLNHVVDGIIEGLGVTVPAPAPSTGRRLIPVQGR